ncbi:phosphonate ABC transporter, permease protein PhnE [Sporolactobacillus sp. THM19-2]|jgi:phosphonate transport system permease protein|uniref:phosphonate ABC transporter, permease protein PhnE n=1 Tax=Sporolactobacillus sp. THM19-2 TaxID=2511171 RepID=UPI001021C93C|nr:phosphonate ABC transporter, permease protein PhnE [Sporolactobacillus sp. THM19-2]RYL92660.1 phosphonate ABC transporter, permease protein PhnE [Sporolactobacillus sp. THM19-2]
MPQNSQQKSVKIPLMPARGKWILTAIVVIVIALYALSARVSGSSPVKFFSGLPYVIQFISHDLIPPDWGYTSRAIERLIETWNMALLATTFSALVVLPFSFLASRNINRNKWLYQITRFFLNIIRTIPDLILAVLFVALIGLGPLSGIGALCVFSFGILAKMISETIEAINPDPLEAIRATGGNIIQVIWYGAMPQILPLFTSYTLYVLELNVRASVVLGFVGAGGVGLILKQQLSLFNYANVSTIIIYTFFAVAIIDLISNQLRRRLV